MQTEFWSEDLRGGDHTKDLGLLGRIILEWILGKYDEVLSDYQPRQMSV